MSDAMPARAADHVAPRLPPTGTHGLDVPERKQVEEALQESQERYRGVFEHMAEGFALHEIITDEQGQPCDYRFLEVNPAFGRLTGLNPGDLVGKRVREALPALETAWLRNYSQVALTGAPMQFEEFSSALNRWYGVSAYQPAPGQLAVMFTDVSARKRAEQEVFQSHQRFEALMRAVPVGVSFSDDVSCQRITGNPAVLAQFEVMGSDNLSASAPDDRAPGRRVCFFREGRPMNDTELPLQRAVTENREIAPMELEVLLPSGRRWFALASGAPIRDQQGKVIGGVAVTQDISERKRAEEALRKSEAVAMSEKEFRLLAEAMPQIVWATRADGWNTYFNQQWVDYTGLTRAESYGHGWTKPFHPEDRQRAWDAWQYAVTHRGTYALECRLRRADGIYRWWLVRGVPVPDENGGILKWLGTCTDIDALKQAEAALREAGEERLRVVLEATSMGTFEVDLRTGEGRWNKVEFELLGLKPGEAPSVPATFFRYVHPEDAGRVQAQWEAAIQSGLLNAEFRIVRADGEVRWLAGMGRFAYASQPSDSALSDEREPARFLGVNFDITERKRVEAALRTSEARYRAIGESIDFGVWVCDPSGRNTYASESFLKLVGMTQEQCSNFGWGEVLHPEDAEATLAAWRECAQSGKPWYREHRCKGVDGRWHPILARGVPIRDPEGRISAWVGINLDISDLKHTEGRLQASLREKEVLLKEIHHRVKNNLQVVSSLVDLQADAVADAALRTVLGDVRDRVRSMALVHEMLYQSESLARVDFAEYSRSLLSHLWRAHGSSSVTIKLSLDLQPTELTVDTAVPCGLILNELAANALKHAFRGRSQGEVTVALHRLPDGRVWLRVSDNGLGLPAGLDWRQSRSMGLGLVQMLAGQLNARLEASTGGGTGFELTFTPPS